jgi:type IV pilus assembly protein PilW
VKTLQRVRGFNLPELMVSLTIGLLLLAAFMVILDRCRREFATNESLASLQDAARSAISVLVPDLEHAGFYGVTATPSAQLARGGTITATATDLRQPSPADAVGEVAGLPPGAHDCGINFAVDLATPVEGANNSFRAGVAARDCAPAATAGGARPGTDTLTLRRASFATVEPRVGRLQLHAHRLGAHAAVTLFADGRAPTPTDPLAEIRDVDIRTYYVANDSVGRRGWPALRVKSLTESRGAAQFRDEEVLPGVEDLQVEFGVATEDGSHATRFVPPDAAGRDQRVRSVRLWLRLRADTTERGFVDTRALNYSDVSFVPSAAEAAQRRLLIERTVALRNVWRP